MPLENVRYRVKTTETGKKVRLAFRGKKKVVEAKNLKTGATHTPAEFMADRAKKKPMPMKRKAMTPMMARVKRIKDFEDAHGDTAL